MIARPRLPTRGSFPSASSGARMACKDDRTSFPDLPSDTSAAVCSSHSSFSPMLKPMPSPFLPNWSYFPVTRTNGTMSSSRAAPP